MRHYSTLQSPNNQNGFRAKLLLPLFVLFVIFLLSSCSSSKDYLSKTRRSKLKISRKSTVKNHHSNRVKIADYAKNFIKTPYRYAGKTPDGFDCSGFTSFVFRNYGIEIGSSSREQAKAGRSKKMGLVDRGDLLFFGNKNKVSHVGMVYAVENDEIMMIHASSSRGVMISNLSASEYWKKKFLFARDIMSSTRNDLAFR